MFRDLCAVVPKNYDIVATHDSPVLSNEVIHEVNRPVKIWAEGYTSQSQDDAILSILLNENHESVTNNLDWVCRPIEGRVPDYAAVI